MRTLRKTVQTIFVTVACVVPTAAIADLDQQLNSIFGALSNTTPPTAAVSDTRRGVISGGSLVVRTKISNPNLISFVPPSFDAGCGGINFFGGSFSFINKEQFQQLLRNIASSAMAYAFELAISAMSEPIAQHMKRFQKAITSMTKHLGNSCQMAQGLVNDTLDAIGAKKHFDAATDATFVGDVEDIFDSGTQQSGYDPQKEMEASGRYANDCGKDANFVWCVLKKHSTANTFLVGGDDDLLESIMTLTGTVIEFSRDAHPEGGQKTDVQFVAAKPEVVKAMLFGGAHDFYVCTDGHEAKECRVLSTTAKQIDNGFVAQVLEMVLGNDGILPKLRDSDGFELTAAQQRFLTNAPGGFGAMLRNIAVKNPQMAEAFAVRAAPVIGMQMMENVLTALEDSARTAVQSSDTSYARELKDLMAEGRKARDALQALIQLQYGNLLSLHEHYLAILQVAPRSSYSSAMAGALYRDSKGTD